METKEKIKETKNRADAVNLYASNCRIIRNLTVFNLDTENKIQWNGGNSFNKTKSYCIKQNEKGTALYALATNPIQKWHFVGKIKEK